MLRTVLTPPQPGTCDLQGRECRDAWMPGGATEFGENLRQNIENSHVSQARGVAGETDHERPRKKKPLPWREGLILLLGVWAVRAP